jgi:YVTN family beta-propeller protein
MTSSFTRKSGRFAHQFRRFVSGLVAFAMATIGLVGIQVAASQPASAAGNAPVGYVVNQTAGTVSVVNLQSNATVTSINVGTTPYAAALSPDGKKLYVANNATASSSISVITVGGSVAGPFGVGVNPYGVALTPDGKNFYVANGTSNTVQPMPTLTNNPATAFAAPGGPVDIKFAPDILPVASLAAPASVATTLPATFNATATDADGTVASYLWDFGDGTALTPSTPGTITHAYAATSKIGYAVKVYAVDDQGVRSLPAIRNVAITGTSATSPLQIGYLSNQAVNTVTEVDLTTGTVLATMPVGDAPNGLAFSRDRKTLYVANTNSSNVSVIDTATNTVTATMTCAATSATLHSKVELGVPLKGVAPAKAAAVVAVPKGGLAWWAWALIGLGIVAAFSFILVMVVRYERRRAASHRA